MLIHTSAARRILPAIIGSQLFFLVPSVEAASILYTYDWTATDLQDSNGNPPPVNTEPLSGVFSILLDTADPGFLPVDAAVGDASVFTTDAGTVIGPTDIGYSVAAASTGTTRRIYVGGLINSAAFIVGLSDDFRLEFIVDWTGGWPSPTGDPVPVGGFAYANSLSNATPSGGSYTGDLAIAVQDVSTVPIPATAWLFTVALGVCVVSRTQRVRK